MAYNIVIVDDCVTVRGLIAKALEGGGLELGDILQAANGREAMELLRHHWVDLVITDIHMPEMDGLDLVQHMVDDEALGSIPVVVVSTEGQEEWADRLWQLGIRGYLRKPFPPNTLADVAVSAIGAPVRE